MTKARDPLWDNVRLVAIVLVVVGHAIEVPDHNDLAFGLYLVIYAFHMPLFAFAAGRFARPQFNLREGAVLVRQLVAPYLIFEVVWALFNLWQTGRFTLDFLYPAWLLWFLVSLMVWRLTLPVLAALRFPVTIAVVIACAGGYFASAGSTLAVARTLAFLPFFVAGWAFHERNYTDRLLAVLRTGRMRVIAGVVLVASVVVATRWADVARDLGLRRWVQGDRSYARIGVDAWWAGGIRLGCLAAAFVLIACVLALVPRTGELTARAGRRTMTVYLLHLFPIAALEHLDLVPTNPSNGHLFVIIAAAVAWAALLSTRVVDRLASPLVSPPVEWLLRPIRTKPDQPREATETSEVPESSRVA